MAVAFQPKGELIATGSSDGKLRLIDAATGDVGREVHAEEDDLTPVSHGDAPFGGVAFHPNGDVIKKTKKAEPGEDFDDEILAAIQSNIKSSKSKEACYVFGDVIKDPMKAIYGDKWRAVVAKKSHNDADAFVRMSFPAGPGKYSYPSVEAGKAYLMAKTTKHGAPYWKNYRLISLLSVVGKLYESVLANRLSCLLDGRDRRGDHLLSQFQGGFRRGRSCQHQSWVLSELIKSNARRGKKTYVAFLDVRKAYPTCRRAAMLRISWIGNDPTHVVRMRGL